MNAGDLAKLMITALEGHETHAHGVYVDAESFGLEDVVIDGHFNMIAVAEAVLDGLEQD